MKFIDKPALEIASLTKRDGAMASFGALMGDGEGAYRLVAGV